VVEAAGFEFEFDAEAAPLAIGTFALGFAIWVAGAHHLYSVVELSCEDAEEEDDALLVDGGVRHFAAVDWIAVEGFVGARFLISDCGFRIADWGLERRETLTRERRRYGVGSFGFGVFV